MTVHHLCAYPGCDGGHATGYCHSTCRPAEASPWSQTTSGRPFPLIRPTAADVHWPDVAAALAHINRYCGNAGCYSVAQHSIYVADDLPHELRPYGLLHDAHEFAIGDMTRPTQLVLASLIGPAFKAARREIQDRVDRAIYGAAGLDWPVPQDVEDLVKLADLRVTLAEKRDILAQPIGKSDAEWLFRDGVIHVQPTERRIKRWTTEHAHTEFLHELRMMGIEV